MSGWKVGSANGPIVGNSDLPVSGLWWFVRRMFGPIATRCAGLLGVLGPAPAESQGRSESFFLTAKNPWAILRCCGDYGNGKEVRRWDGRQVLNNVLGAIRLGAIIDVNLRFQVSDEGIDRRGPRVGRTRRQ